MSASSYSEDPVSIEKPHLRTSSKAEEIAGLPPHGSDTGRVYYAGGVQRLCATASPTTLYMLASDVDPAGSRAEEGCRSGG
ncbi:unnamed protein product [Rangifer tarandus platyrhynchus]|uniref:Uncharacterized protein n=1 Tax=Rangifer tarandus platyrhynchus TaxID=3082113 RepID=A0ACB1KEF5_RANTA